MDSLRILIADNESIIRMDLKELLEEAGHEVIGEAADGHVHQPSLRPLRQQPRPPRSSQPRRPPPKRKSRQRMPPNR